MSGDIATLGLAVDSRQVTSATKALDDLTAAAKPAAAAATDLSKATTTAATSAAGMQNAVKPATAAVTALTAAAKPAAAAVTAAATSATSVSAAASGAAANVVSFANAANKAATGGAKALTTQTGLARYELINLSRQFQDVGVSLASGQSPLLVAVQQGAQIADVFASSTGTVGGFVKQVASGLANILTPARLVVGGIAAIGLAAVTSTISWAGAQRDIQVGLIGIGRASGATVGDINKIADATSSLKGLSVSEARETATALASTGKIGVDNITLLTANTKNFAAVLGLDVPKAAEAMAKIFSNPTEGAKTLAASIGGIDSVTMKYIETLDAQGDRQGAIKALADATIPAISKASEQTGNLSKGWTIVSNAASGAYTSIGKTLSQFGTNGLGQQAEDSLEKQRKSLEALIATMQTAQVPDFDMRQAVEQLAALNDALMKVQANKKAALGIDAAQTTLQVAPIVQALAPAPELIRQVNANLELMTKVMNDPAFEAFRQKVGDQLPLALARLSNQAAALKINPALADPIQSQIQSLTLQNQLLTNSSPAMRQRVEYQLAYNDAIRQGAKDVEATAIATARGKQAYGGPAADIQQQQQLIALYGSTASAAEVARSVDLQAQAAHLQGINIDGQRLALIKQLAVEQSTGVAAIKASTDAQRVDAATVGMSVGAATEYTAVQNALNAAKQQGRVLTQDNIASIQSEAAALGQAAANADMMKWSYTNLVQGPLQTFTSSISQGASAMDALKKSGVSALNSIASKLMDMAAQNLWKSAFGSATSGIFGSLFGGASSGVGAAQAASGTGLSLTATGGLFANGGYTGSGGKYEPAGIVHKGEYVMDAASTSRIGVGRLNALRGYANGGIVDSAPAFSRGGASNDNGSMRPSVSITNYNDFRGADPGSEARMRQYVDQSSKQAVQTAVQQVSTIKGTSPGYLRSAR